MTFLRLMVPAKKRPSGEHLPSLKRLFFFLSGCICLVAAYFFAKGAWLVLPFAGLEILVLGLGIYLSARWSAGWEAIELTQGELRLTRGRTKPEETMLLSRHWTRISLISDPRGWYPSRLLLECHGKRVEVGKVLVESERVQLAADLHANLNFRTSESLPIYKPLPEGLESAGQHV